MKALTKKKMAAALLTAVVAFTLFLAVACKQTVTPDRGSGTAGNEEAQAALDGLKDGDVLDIEKEGIDLGEGNVDIDKAVTIQNADCNGATLTIKTSGVTLKNLSNVGTVNVDASVKELILDGETDITILNATKNTTVKILSQDVTVWNILWQLGTSEQASIEYPEGYEHKGSGENVLWARTGFWGYWYQPGFGAGTTEPIKIEQVAGTHVKITSEADCDWNANAGALVGIRTMFKEGGLYKLTFKANTVAGEMTSYLHSGGKDGISSTLFTPVSLSTSEQTFEYYFTVVERDLNIVSEIRFEPYAGAMEIKDLVIEKADDTSGWGLYVENNKTIAITMYDCTAASAKAYRTVRTQDVEKEGIQSWHASINKSLSDKISSAGKYYFKYTDNNGFNGDLGIAYTNESGAWVSLGSATSSSSDSEGAQSYYLVFNVAEEQLDGNIMAEFKSYNNWAWASDTFDFSDVEYGEYTETVATRLEADESVINLSSSDVYRQKDLGGDWLLCGYFEDDWITDVDYSSTGITFTVSKEYDGTSGGIGIRTPGTKDFASGDAYRWTGTLSDGLDYNVWSTTGTIKQVKSSFESSQFEEVLLNLESQTVSAGIYITINTAETHTISNFGIEAISPDYPKELNGTWCYGEDSSNTITFADGKVSSCWIDSDIKITEVKTYTVIEDYLCQKVTELTATNRTETVTLYPDYDLDTVKKFLCISEGVTEEELYTGVKENLGFTTNEEVDNYLISSFEDELFYENTVFYEVQGDILTLDGITCPKVTE